MYRFLMNRLFFSILAMFTVSICNAATFTITPQINFGTVTPDSDLQPEITISNTGVDAIQVGGIATANTVIKPFKVIDVGCANSIIQSGDQCSFMVQFTPGSECGKPPLTIDPDYDTEIIIYNDCISLVPGKIYNDSFNIEIVSDSSSHEVLLSGQGGAAQDEPDIQVSFSSVNFGTVDVLENTDSPYIFPPAGSIFAVIFIINIGDLDLDISSVSVTGQDLSEVSFQGECAAVIAPGKSCGILIEFKPVSPGGKNAAVSIMSNDPDESVFDILVRGNAVGEDDGVLATVEDAGPNNGDGNYDDILDSKQSNVVTLIDVFGNYVTYLTDNTFRFRNMSALQQTEVPADFVIASGIFDFTVEGIAVPDQLLEVGIILPAGMIPGAYYMYGPTADNPDKHWFNFNYDGETGAFILGDVSFTASSGEKFTRSVLKIRLKDGARGDADLTVNGTIAVTSAMSISSDEGSASISFLQLLCLTFIMFLARFSERERLFFWKL